MVHAHKFGSALRSFFENLLNERGQEVLGSQRLPPLQNKNFSKCVI